MKILPQKFRETQREWFGKRGISMHVDSIFMLVDDNLAKVTFLTLIDQTKQDAHAVLCIFQHVLKKLRRLFPGKNKIYLRSDNAECYSSAESILKKMVIAKNEGAKLVRLDFNEPQRGKDQCDRDSAVVKRKVCSFLNAGNDVVSAENVKAAIDWNGGIPNMMPSILNIASPASNQAKVSINNVSSYHSVEFFDTEVRMWQYYDIGDGKTQDLLEMDVILNYNTVSDFSNVQLMTRRKLSKSKPTSILNCTATFSLEQDLESHIAFGKHAMDQAPDQLARSSKDKIRVSYANRMNSLSIIRNEAKASSDEATTSGLQSDPIFKQGWARKIRSKPKYLSEKQKSFLLEI
jgi:hypothetical protein